MKLDDLNFKPGAPVKKLQLAGGKTYNGEATDKFVEAKLFDFATLDTTFEGYETNVRCSQMIRP